MKAVVDRETPTGVRLTVDDVMEWNSRQSTTPPIDHRFSRALANYVTRGIPPGDFLSGVLASDLFYAHGHADDLSWRQVRSLILFIYNELPAVCWGSWRAVNTWIAGAEIRR